MNLNNQRVTMSKQSSMTQTSASKNTSRSVGTISNYASNRPATLTEGQVIKGEVTDLRNHEVSVVLENNTKVTAYIENPANLSIGQPAAFRVSSISPDGIVLEPLPNSYSTSENITIRKALEEAGLPLTDHNKEIVHELLQNQMSINKQSIQNMLQQTLQFKDISTSTLVLMNKLHIPITPENAIQFENYRNFEHRLIKDLSNITDMIPSLLEHLSEENTPQAVSRFANDLISQFINSFSMNSSQIEKDPILQLSMTDRENLINILSKFNLSEALKESILNGTATLRDIHAMIQSAIDIADEVDLKNMEEALLSLGDSLDTESNPEMLSLDTFQIPKALDELNSPVIQNILEKFELLQSERSELGFYLSIEEREQLLDTLKDFPIHPNMKAKILSGEATSNEVIHVIKNTMNLVPPELTQAMLKDSHFQHVLKEYMLSKWTITPSQLMENNRIHELYDTVYNQTQSIENLIKTALSGTESSTLVAQTEHIRQNMDFMQTLNNFFPYIQIPLKLKDRNIHSELYVYTKKKNLQQDPEHISVLLHLDLDYLGPLDVHVALNSNQVATKFYFASQEAKELISQNIDDLAYTLNEKGFLFTSELLDRTKEIDIVKDFIETKPANSMKRFSFDIRA